MDFRNVMFCEPKYFERLKELKTSIAKETCVYGFKIIPHPYCDNNKAYLIDGEGKIHTIIIEE